MAEEEKAPEAAAAAPEGGGKGNKLVLIASLVNIVGTVGMLAVLFLAFQKEKSKPSVDDVVAGQAKHGGGHGEKKEEGGHGGGGHGEKGHAPASAEVHDTGKIIALDPFTVNLATSVGTHPRYIRINISTELEPGGVEKEFEIKLPRIRDTIINLLNSKKANELNQVEGREQLKQEMKRTINSFLLQCKVKDIYFTNLGISN